MASQDDLKRSLVAELSKTLVGRANEKLPALLRAHDQAPWLAVAIQYEKKAAMSGAPPAWFPSGDPVAVVGDTEADLLAKIRTLREEAAREGRRVEALSCRRDGQWEESARKLLEEAEAPG